MFLKLLLIFTIVPVAELYLLIKIGSSIGAFNTVLIIIITGIAGASLARLEGFHIMKKLQSRLASGELPHDELIQGLIVLVGGITLLTPGFLTDIFGLSLILPGTRRIYAGLVKNYFEKSVKQGKWHVHSGPIDMN